jgi:hypothetical protein
VKVFVPYSHLKRLLGLMEARECTTIQIKLNHVERVFLQDSPAFCYKKGRQMRCIVCANFVICRHMCGLLKYMKT